MNQGVLAIDRPGDPAFNAGMTSSPRSPILVLGGTGKTGRRIVSRLSERGVPVRVGSRSGTPPFDWQDTATWAPALQGARAAYVSYFPDIAVPGAPEAIAELASVERSRNAPRARGPSSNPATASMLVDART